MALPVQATFRTALSTTLRFLGRRVVPPVTTLCRWLVTTAQPVEPVLHVNFMDQASAWRGCRTAPITTPPRARLQRHAERAVPQEARAILAAGLVAHVGFVERGQPYVIPMAYHYDPTTPRTLYLHGAHVSRLIRHLAGGASAAIAVTLVDGLVFSRTALYHSVNYRSVVCFTHAAPPLDGEVAARVLEAMIARYFPGRTAGRDYAAPTPEHLDATGVVALEIEEWSAKARRGGPLGPLDDDPDAPGSAGVLDLSTRS
jgi:uncharacterized protein